MGWKTTGTLQTDLEPPWNPAGTPPEPPKKRLSKRAAGAQHSVQVRGKRF